MLFSILIANYNNGHFFNDCYESILKQTYTNWEVILVDDGSTDNSVRLIEEYIKNDSRFKLLLNKKNRGCGYAKNKCAKMATGEILGYLDPDDALKENALELMVNLHKKNKDIAIITSKYELVDLEMNFIKDGAHGSSIPKKKSYLTYGKGALTAFATFKRDKYLQSDGIDPIMKRAVDQDLYYKMEEQGDHLFLDKVLYKYRIHPNSISSNNNLYKAHYWHFYAKIKAFERRKHLQLKIDNFSNEYIKKYKSNYYLERFKKIKNTKKTSAKFYFLFKSIIVHPTNRFKLKFKSLILLVLGKI